MADGTTDAFMRSLQQAEASGEVGPLVALFAEDAELENPARSLSRRGRDGAAQFWHEYLGAFSAVRSRFTRVHEGDGAATLEWVSDGVLPSGTPLSYRGVSLIEFSGGDGLDGEVARPVRRFCTYYDSATFLPQHAKQADPPKGS